MNEAGHNADDTHRNIGSDTFHFIQRKEVQNGKEMEYTLNYDAIYDYKERK